MNPCIIARNGEKEAPRVAIAIVTWNSAAEIGECLSDLGQLPDNWQVWVVDNKSSDETVATVSQGFPYVHIISNQDNKGFAAACNQIVAETDTDYVLFLNPDTKATAESLVRALEIAEENESVGILGVKTNYPDGSLQTTCFHFPTLWKNAVDSIGLFRFFSPAKLDEMLAGDFFAHDTERSVDWLMGAFMLVRRKAINLAGALPEDYFMFAEDMDFCWQMRRHGFDVRFTPEVSIVHAANKSAGQLPTGWRIERTLLSKYLFCFKNFGWLTTRLIQLSDVVGCNYRIWSYKFAGSREADVAAAKSYRREMLRSLFLSRKRIAEILQTR